MFRITYATSEDNSGLLELFKYPESSSLKYIMDRSPDYFSFCNIHENYKVIIAKEKYLTGAVTLTFSRVNLEGRPGNIAYISDLRVDSASRKKGLGHSLLQEAMLNCNKSEDKPVPVFACVFKDNAGGLKSFTNLGFITVAAICAYFILPVSLKKQRVKDDEFSIRTATTDDVPEMMALWHSLNSRKNLALDLNEENFYKWLENVAGLSISSYLLVIGRDNKIKGFLALWNQSELRRITITTGSNFIRIIRRLWNIFRPVTGFTAFPPPGEPLNFYNVFNLCVPEKEEVILKLLLENAFASVKKNNALFLAFALDKKDPLNSFLKGYIASKSEIALLSNYNFNNSIHKNKLFHLEISL